MIELIALVGSATATFLIVYFGGLVGSFVDVWKPILLFAGLFIAFVALFFVFAFAVTAFIDIKKPIKKPSKFYTWLYYTVNAFLVRFFGVKLTVNGEAVPNEPCVFIMNHRSNFDPMILSDKYKKNKILHVSKPGNFKIPIAGPAIHKAGFLAIDRANDREALKTILKAVDYVSQGYSIGIFPEGTRNKDGLDLLPFRAGAFKIATKAKAPIVVIAAHGTQDIKHNFPLKRTAVTLDVLAVLRYEDYKDKTTAEISDTCAALMQADIDSKKQA